jgi:hypothetical protein
MLGHVCLALTVWARIVYTVTFLNIPPILLYLGQWSPEIIYISSTSFGLFLEKIAILFILFLGAYLKSPYFLELESSHQPIMDKLSNIKC